MVIGSGHRKVEISGELPILYLREGDVFIAYTPALDLSSYGESFEEARKNFHEAVALFFEDLCDNGTVETVLEECGWTRVTRPTVHWIPPAVICQESMSLHESCRN